MNPRPRWAHLAGNNPYTQAKAAATVEVEQPTGEVSTEGLVRSSAVVGLGTALSRLTGLVRTVALAYALGRGALADSYNLANTAPNIVYDLLLGGILSATLVPVFVERYEHDDEDGVNAVVTVTVGSLIVLTLAAVVAAPLIFHVYTWAADDAAELRRTGVPFLRFFLPQILFYGLTTLATALLNARRRFAAAAFAPVLNNVVVCAILVAFVRMAGKDPTIDQVVNDRSLLLVLAIGTTAGIVVMTLALWPSLRQAGIRWRWRFEPRHPAVRKVAALSGWTIGYVIANQVALAIVLALAAGKNQGDATAYLYAFQFFQLPYGLFAVSLMTTFTPELASAASRRDGRAFRDRLATGIRLMTLVVLPSSVGMAVLARPLLVGVLGHGSFGGDAPIVTADVLANFAVGLLGFSLYLFVLRGFYAIHDTRTPFFLNVFENALNVVIGLALVGRFGVQGLAFSYSVAYIVSAFAAFVALRRRVGLLGGRRLAWSTFRIGLASAAMGVAVWYLIHAVGSPTGSGALVRVVVGVAAGVAVYGVAAVALRLEDLQSLRSRFLRESSRVRA